MLRRWMVVSVEGRNAHSTTLGCGGLFLQRPRFPTVGGEQFQRIGDLERIISKVAVGRVSPRERWYS
ncbi:MAG: hypothetical protein ACLTGI_03795 [Hoylesella buccalis]